MCLAFKTLHFGNFIWTTIGNSHDKTNELLHFSVRLFWVKFNRRPFICFLLLHRFASHRNTATFCWISAIFSSIFLCLTEFIFYSILSYFIYIDCTIHVSVHGFIICFRVNSPIDDFPMDGVMSLRVKSFNDLTHDTYTIRWTEVLYRSAVYS